MRENADQNNSEYGHFLYSVCNAEFPTYAGILKCQMNGNNSTESGNSESSVYQI